MNLSLRVLRFVKIKDTPRLHYSRWTHRRPIAVINPEDESKGIKRNRTRNIQRPSAQNKLDENSEAESTIDVTRNQKKLEYKTIEKDDPGFTKLMMTVKHRVSKKKQSDLILLEGIRLIQDAIDAKVNMQTLLFSRLSDVMKLSLPDNVQLFKLPYKSLQLWSNLTTSPGIMGVFEKPNVENREPVPESIPLTIICDNVREPGNLGSILRAAAGVGCRRVILMKGCVDLWDSKVLRGGAGAHFRIPIHPNRTWNEMFSLLNQNTSIFIADSNTNFESTSEVDTSEAMELNLDELDLDSNKSERLSKKIKALVQNLTSRIPVVPYYAVDYTDNEDTVLVVSGETECLSLESFDVFDKNAAVRVNIPLINGVDSLNNSVAFGIVAYEVKRQLLMKKNVIK